MKRYWFFVVVMLLMLVMLACTAGPNPVTNIAVEGRSVAGFWMGLWHGLIAPLTFIISLFTSDVKMYEVHNSGVWYDFGFVLGAGILFGGSASSR